MINKEIVKDVVKSFIAGTDIFLVDIKVSTTNRISVLLNKPSGITIEECAGLSRHIEEKLDREREDFELKVSSPGLNTPFRVREQYEMSIGKTVEVVDNEGKKIKGVLKNVEGEGFEIETEKVKNKKNKTLEQISFNFDEVKTVKEIIKFK
ncbi:MAG: ribosome assembly cofactor RimP [Bacteroidota bacterium]